MTRTVPLLCLLLLSCSKPSTPAAAPAPAQTPRAPAQAQAGAPTPRPEGSAAPGTAPSAQGPKCSASSLSAEPNAPKPSLPPVVESMRRHIVAAAVACDYDALAKLARENGEEFNFGFGPETDVAATWRKQEQEGVPVLAMLVKVLNLPNAKEETSYLWPSAYRTGETAEDWKALEGLYPAEQLARWRNSDNGYVGFRTAIDEKGDWLFALSGD